MIRDRDESGTLSARPRILSKKRVIKMDVEMAADIASCLLGAVMVGAALTYAWMYRLIAESYEEGWHDSLSRELTSDAVEREPDVPVDQTDTTAMAPRTARPSSGGHCAGHERHDALGSRGAPADRGPWTGWFSLRKSRALSRFSPRSRRPLGVPEV